MLYVALFKNVFATLSNCRRIRPDVQSIFFSVGVVTKRGKCPTACFVRIKIRHIQKKSSFSGNKIWRLSKQNKMESTESVSDKLSKVYRRVFDCTGSSNSQIETALVIKDQPLSIDVLLKECINYASSYKTHNIYIVAYSSFYKNCVYKKLLDVMKTHYSGHEADEDHGNCTIYFPHGSITVTQLNSMILNDSYYLRGVSICIVGDIGEKTDLEYIPMKKYILGLYMRRVPFIIDSTPILPSSTAYKCCKRVYKVDTPSKPGLKYDDYNHPMDESVEKILLTVNLKIEGKIGEFGNAVKLYGFQYSNDKCTFFIGPDENYIKRSDTKKYDIPQDCWLFDEDDYAVGFQLPYPINPDDVVSYK